MILSSFLSVCLTHQLKTVCVKNSLCVSKLGCLHLGFLYMWIHPSTDSKFTNLQLMFELLVCPIHRFPGLQEISSYNWEGGIERSE